jgi:hypothetical protein
MDTAPKPPKTRGVILSVAALVLLVVPCLLVSNHPQTQLGLFGLGLDILGATILAIPDVTLLSRYTYAGQLNDGLQTLTNHKSNFDGLAAPDSQGFKGMLSSAGFHEVVDVIQHLYDDKALTEDANWDDIQMVATKLQPTTSESSTQPEATARVITAYDTESTPVLCGDGPTIQSAIRQQIENMNGRFRRAGLFTLITGFIVQSTAYLV